MNALLCASLLMSMLGMSEQQIMRRPDSNAATWHLYHDRRCWVRPARTHCRSRCLQSGERTQIMQRQRRPLLASCLQQRPQLLIATAFVMSGGMSAAINSRVVNTCAGSEGRSTKSQSYALPAPLHWFADCLA